MTDANGWTVYDYGVWKEYEKITGPHSVSSLGTLSSAAITSTQAMSVGTVPNTVYVQLDIRQFTTTSAVRYFAGSNIYPTAAIAPSNYSVYVRNLTSSTLTDSNIYITHHFRDK